MATTLKRYLPLVMFFIILAGAKGANPFDWRIIINKEYLIRNLHLFNTDSAIVVSENAIEIISTKDGAILDTFPDVTKYIPMQTPASSMYGIAYSDLSKDGKLLVTASLFDDVKCIIAVWDVAKRTPIKCFETPYSIRDVKFTLDSKYLIATAYYSDESVIVWNTNDYSIERTITDPSRGIEITLSPDNKYAYIGYLLQNATNKSTPSIVRYDLNNWNPIDTFNLNDELGFRMTNYAACWNVTSPDGKYFAFTCDTTVYVYETEKLQMVNRYNFTTYPTVSHSTLGSICFSPNSDKIFMFQDIAREINPCQTAIEWDFKTNKVINKYSNPDLPLFYRNHYLNSDKILSASGNTIALFDFAKAVSGKTDLELSDKLKITYENPVSKNTELKIISKEAMDVNIDIYNESGKYVKNIYHGFLKGDEIVLPLDISELNSGLYFIKVSDGITTFDYQLIVKK